MSAHHGETIERIIRREGHSISEVAKSIGISRRSLYSWFLQARIKVDLISKIGQVINYDFSKEFPELYSESANDDDTGIWKEKYFNLLEKYNALPTIIMESKSLKVSHGKFYVVFVNNDNKEYRLVLANQPTKLFIDTCKSAGYIIKCVNRDTG
jgi:transcriptional regulator with XRE-family HTH domain